MGQISAENSELRIKLSTAEANVKKVQSALDASEAQVWCENGFTSIYLLK